MNCNFVFEEQWFTPLFKACKDAGLEWPRMAAIILLKSNGDPNLRVIDWEYIYNNLNADNPLYAGFWSCDDMNVPNIEIIDRGTKWGLFQIRGERAIRAGYKGQILGLASIGANIKLATSMLVNEIDRINIEAEALEASGNRDKIFHAYQIRGAIPGIAEEKYLMFRQIG